jgi:spore photoproduct lyase
MWRFFAADYSYCRELVSLFKLKKRMAEPHFQIFAGNAPDGTEVELVIAGNTPVKAAMAAGYVMSGQGVDKNDVCVCFEKASEAEADCGICAEIHDIMQDRYYYPDICPVHSYKEYSSENECFAAWYETLTCFYMQHQIIFFGCNTGWAEKFYEFMKSFHEICGQKHPFHHVYVERKLRGQYDVTGIFDKLSGSRVVWINHYKDIFNRKGQSLAFQKKSPALILAKKEGKLVYNGSKECQSFGNEHFYYTSCIMNCLFDCEYCYLQGMYPSADVVLFMNLDDIFHEVDELLREHGVYLCISYDTDLVALENITGYCRRWIEYAKNRVGLTIELRTKAELSDSFIRMLDEKECENIIFAFTLSTDMIQLSYEHNTSSIQSRIASIMRASQKGLNVRVCFDPLLTYADLSELKKAYGTLIDKLFESVTDQMLYDVSLGEFRVPCDYLKRMRKRRPGSKLLAYQFEIEDGSFCCGKNGTELADYVEECLRKHLSPEKIYRWR